jgi:cobalt-zinc-cadmium efflux system outer membrane protein
MRRLIMLSMLGAASTLAGCSTSPRRSYGDVEGMIKDRTMTEVRLNPPADGAADPVKEMLAQPLTAERAAQIALLRNAAFKVKLQEVGLAQAELAQAGIVENPRLHASWRYPKGGGAQGTGRELGISFNILDLFELPLRRNFAGSQLEQAKFRLGHEVLGLAAQVKQAFYEYQAAQQRLRLRRDTVESLATAVELSKRQRTAGANNKLDYANERAAHQEAEIALAEAEAETVATREHLSLLLGAQGPAEWKVEDELPEPPPADPELAATEAAAVAQRWDLQAARREPLVLKQAMRINRLDMFSGVNVGIDSEREFDGANGVGPSLELGIPLFDRKQAASARLKARLRQSYASADALEAEIRLEVRVASARLLAARKATFAYKRKLVPLRREVLDETLKRYNFMLLGVYHVLQAKREEIGAESGYIEALKEYWSERGELERAAGGKLPEAPSAAAPVKEETEEPEQKTAPAGQHHHHGGQ